MRASRDVIYPGQQTAVVLYSEAFAQQRRPVAQKFMNAYIRAVRDYNDALKDGRLAGPNADEIISILTEYTNDQGPQHLRDHERRSPRTRTATSMRRR